MDRIKISELFTDVETKNHVSLDAGRTVYPTDDVEAISEDAVFFLTKTAKGERRQVDLSNKAPYAIVCEDDEEIDGINAKAVIVNDCRRAFAQAYSNYCKIDYSATRFIAVTGTNGKTTVSEMIAYILRFAGFSVGYIGTGLIRINEEIISDRYYSMTTPDPDVLYPTIKRMQDAGCEFIVMEASSHSLKLGKLCPISFDVGIFTNLSGEHMDFHTSTEDYYNSKLMLFRNCKRGIFNADCPHSLRAYKECGIEKHLVGIVNKADVYATDVVLRGLSGSSFFYRESGLIFGVDLRMCGAFNVYNALMALKCSILLGVKPCIAKRAVNSFDGVGGRMEQINSAIKVIIDYAHTPNAVTNVLKTLYMAKNKRQSLIVVFGCGGNRDRSKRAEMGKAAAAYADYIVLTEDNSRQEKLEEIISDIVGGIPEGYRYSVIRDRASAIRHAILSARDGDIVAVLGKGREDYMIDKSGYRPYSDKQAVLDALTERGEQSENKA